MAIGKTTESYRILYVLLENNLSGSVYSMLDRDKVKTIENQFQVDPHYVACLRGWHVSVGIGSSRLCFHHLIRVRMTISAEVDSMASK